jgi:hypothetical protein
MLLLRLDHRDLGHGHVNDAKLDALYTHIPLNVLIGVHDGTFHNFTLPDQLPVARIWLFGEKRTCAMGRSSPIWEPRLAKFYERYVCVNMKLVYMQEADSP